MTTTTNPLASDVQKTPRKSSTSFSSESSLNSDEEQRPKTPRKSLGVLKIKKVKKPGEFGTSSVEQRQAKENLFARMAETKRVMMKKEYEIAVRRSPLFAMCMQKTVRKNLANFNLRYE